MGVYIDIFFNSDPITMIQNDNVLYIATLKFSFSIILYSRALYNARINSRKFNSALKISFFGVLGRLDMYRYFFNFNPIIMIQNDNIFYIV